MTLLEVNKKRIVRDKSMLASKDDTINDQKAFILQMGIKWQLERHSEVFEFFKATFF